jgi:hypothetical protein
MARPTPSGLVVKKASKIRSSLGLTPDRDQHLTAHPARPNPVDGKPR